MVYGQEYTTQYQGNKATVIAVSGLLKDDLSLLEFFKKYPVWEQQVTNQNSITLEFIGFEKKNSVAEPFKYGKKPLPSEDNPVLGSTFIKNDGMSLSKTIYFDNYGTAYWSTGTSNSNVKGNYSYNLSEGVVNLNMPQANQQVFFLRRGNGKNLGITGEAVENVSLIDKSSGEVYTKQANQSNDYENTPQDLSWMLPENRFLVKFTLRYDGYETINGITSIKKNKVEERYAFIKSFTVTERETKVKYGVDLTVSEQRAAGLIKDYSMPWKTVVIQLVTEIEPTQYIPGTSLGPSSSIGLSSMELITWGQTTNPNEGFKNKSSNLRLITGNSLWPFGWESSRKIILPENHYLSPALNGGTANSSSFGSEVDANCIMTFMPVINTKGGVNLGGLISLESYNLEANSLLTFDKLGYKSYKFEIVSKKIFGKAKSKKGTWSVSPTSQTITFKFDDGEEKTFLVTQISDGFMYEFKDSSGTVFSLKKVQKN
jgi:hypothetical protein